MLNASKIKGKYDHVKSRVYNDISSKSSREGSIDGKKSFLRSKLSNSNPPWNKTVKKVMQNSWFDKEKEKRKSKTPVIKSQEKDTRQGSISLLNINAEAKPFDCGFSNKKITEEDHKAFSGSSNISQEQIHDVKMEDDNLNDVNDALNELKIQEDNWN